MTLRVLIGPANAGKSGVAYGRLRERVASGATAALLLPSEPDVVRAVREFSAETPLGLTIATFDRYLARLWNRGGDGRRIVTPVQRAALLGETVSTDPGDALAHERSRGLLEVLSIVVQRAAERDDRSAGDVDADGMAGHLLRWARSYRRSLKARGLIEPGEAYRTVLSRLADGGLPDVVVVNRFTDLTAAQEAFVVRAAQRGSELLVALTYDPGIPATAGAEALVARLAERGTAERVAGTSATPSPELVAIEHHLGEPTGMRLVPAGDVILSEAWGDRAEAARIVAEVQRALAEGVPAGRIAVAFRAPEAHVGALRQALAEADVSAEYDLTLPFRATGLGRALHSMLAYAASPAASLGDLVDVLRTPYSPASDDVIDDIDARFRRERGAGAAVIERAVARADRPAGEFIREVRAACGQGVAGAGALRWCRLIGGMLGRAHGRGRPLDFDGYLDAAAQQAFMQMLDDLNDIGAGEATPARLVDMVSALHVTAISSDRADRVQVMAVERLRGRRFECVVLGGLAGDEFPRPERDDALSAPALAAALSRAGIDVGRRGGSAEERLLFYQAATRAVGRLVLSWQSHDASGRPRRRSVFVEELLDLYRDGPDDEAGDPPLPHRAVRLDELSADADVPASGRRTLQDAARSGARSLAGEHADRLAVARYRAYRRAPVLDATSRGVLADRESFSASEIETYLQCPYRWFVGSVVRPRALDAEVDASAEGVVAHSIMQRFYERFAETTGEARVTPANLEAALAVYETVAGEVAAQTQALTLAEQAAIRSMAQRTARLVEADATLLPGMTPRYREWSFGLTEGDPGEDLGGFRLVGRVDRIDVDDAELVITDYKRSGVGSDRTFGKFADKGLVQLPLYAAVAARRLRLEVAGGVYRSPASDKPRGFIHEARADGAFVRTDSIDHAGIATLIEDAVARSRDAVEGMREARIAAAPSGSGCPDYCPARTYCGGGGGRRGRAR